MGRTYDPPSQVTIRYTHSARLLRKLDHILVWILSTNTGLDFTEQYLLCPAKSPDQDCKYRQHILIHIVFHI